MLTKPARRVVRAFKAGQAPAEYERLPPGQQHLVCEEQLRYGTAELAALDEQIRHHEEVAGLSY